MRLTTFRKTTQGVTFTLFIILFLFTVYPFPEKFPVDAFLRLDPLVALIAMIASRAFIATMIWAVAIIILTVIIGRFFCGYICPLGTFIDIVNYLFFRKHYKQETLKPKPNRNIKYFILIGVIAASLLGANLLHFFSPMAITPRVFTLVIFPPILWFSNFVIDLFRPILFTMGMDSIVHFTFHKLYFTGTVTTFLLIGVIIVANYWRKRFWCRYICPTGALISIFSRFGIFKRTASSQMCNICQDCISSCDMRAIEADPAKIILSECTLCGNCVDACNSNGVSIKMLPSTLTGNSTRLNVKRRQFIYSAAAGIIGASAIKAGLHNKKNINGRYIRPPGSIPEKDFLARCIRCGECMKVCKTNGLQPTNLEAGFDALWTPHLVPRTGPCEDKCNMCGRVCPTQAIRSLPVDEKLFVKIGTAVIDRDRCIAWEQNKLCLICDEICPYDAIEFKVVTTFTGPFKRPFVVEEKCTGCGWCENKCPVLGRGAIEVYSIGEERLAKGSYITERKKEMREVTDNEETSYDAEALGSGGETGAKQKQQEVSSPYQQETGQGEKEQVPGGFITEEKEEEPLPGGFTLD